MHRRRGFPLVFALRDTKCLCGQPDERPQLARGCHILHLLLCSLRVLLLLVLLLAGVQGGRQMLHLTPKPHVLGLGATE